MPVGCLLRDWHLQNAEKKQPSCSYADFGFGCEAYNCSINDCSFILRPTHALHGILKCCIDQYKQLQTSCFETFYRQQNNGQWHRGNIPRALFTTPPSYMIEKANKSCSRHRNSKTNKILFFKKKNGRVAHRRGSGWRNLLVSSLRNSWPHSREDFIKTAHRERISDGTKLV